MFSVSSAPGFSLRGSADRQCLDFLNCFVLRDWWKVQSPDHWRGLVGLHPDPDILLLGELPPWLGLQDLTCSEEPISSGTFTLQVLKVVRCTLSASTNQRRF